MGATSSSKSEPPCEDEKFTSFLNAVCDGEQNVDVNRDKFVAFFPKEAGVLAKRLLQRITSKSGGATASRTTCHDMIQEITRLTTAGAHIKLYLGLYYSSDDGELNSEDFLDLLKLAHSLQCKTTAVSFENVTKDDELLKALAATIVNQGDERVEWICQNCSDIFTALHTWLTGLVTGIGGLQVGVDVEVIPSSCLLNSVWWWLLSSTLPSLFSQSLNRNQSTSTSPLEKSSSDTRQFWTSLYSSNEHGLSVNRFQHHIFDYRGPTILLITCDDGHCFALAVDTEWREGTTPWGKESCCLIEVSPDYRIVEEGSQMVLFNEKSRNIPRGLFIGRDKTRYSLKITDGLQQAEFNGKTTNVIDMEVWGCGGAGASSHQADQKKREKKDAERHAKVKRPGKWEENPDRLLLQWGGASPSYQDQFRAEMAPDASS